MKRALLLTFLALGACTMTGFNQEAGIEVVRGGGEVTATNTGMMAGERDFAVSMTRAFQAAVPSTVNFAFNSSTLDATAKARLREQAAWIKRYPAARFRVFGHTDLVGSAAYNDALGLRRAQAVVAYLGTQGISRARLEAVISKGKTQPLVQTPGPERQNRRTVTEVSGLARSGDGRLLNGKYAAVIFKEYVASATAPHTLAPVSTSSAPSGSAPAAQ